MAAPATEVTVGEQPPKEPPQPPARKPITEMTVEEMVAKAIVPVKKEFIIPLPKRLTDNENGSSNDVVPASTISAPPPVSKEKKSKRQLKRERNQEKQSTRNLCPMVAKGGKLDSCPYGDKCRFSHDIEAFIAQKPADLEGNCPFDSDKGACPYGLGCRYLGTHRTEVSAATPNCREESEVNGLKKDVQKLLWKNKMQFPKADAKLKALGLMGPSKLKKAPNADEKEDSQTILNGSHLTNGNGSGEVAAQLIVDNGCCPEVHEKLEDINGADDPRPLKKGKSLNDETFDPIEETNGASLEEKDLDTSSAQLEPLSTADHVETDKSLKSHPREKKLIDFRDKLYLAPLTTVGNLPFRRVCKSFGVDITCGEMAMCTNLIQGQAAEWALLRRHVSEDLFGVQICGAYPDTVARAAELIEQECSVDFIDINMGCPIDLVVSKGAGSALLSKPMRMKNLIHAVSSTVDIPITIKARTSYYEGRSRIDSVIADVAQWGASAVTIHGRSRQQRYTKQPDWEYVYQCTRKAPDTLQVLGNGDIFSFSDWNKHKSNCPELSSCMIARGALVKPWLFTEIKEQRDWDISSGERLNILKDYVRFGLEHWGSDTKGVETTRSFLLEWLSYTYRYVPVGLLEVLPQRLNSRPPAYFGRDDLETLMASESAVDWIKISEMLLGKVPVGFSFSPKHKSNAFDKAENG
uniref:tRNA-dihydrouridine(47) synthase [NAD(P)(+)]-like n=1 Tax=Erigeron canadensis TaxID=72917 RepID=UPI001CB90CFE|nr:tRNA-dihydrouridine(47) synthase [NAD(P)(+)]-like [Erigeron canadensis]